MMQDHHILQGGALHAYGTVRIDLPLILVC
jgi:hypothetical protein